MILLLLAACGKHAYPDGSGLQGQLEREVVALQQTVQRLQTEAATCESGGKTDRIYAELKQALAGEAEVDAEGPATRVVLPDSLLFGADGLTLRDEARAPLDLIATALKDHIAHTISVEGHTSDLIPSNLSKRYGSLWDLSYVHAALVRDVLTRDFGVPEERTSLVARGPYAPLASNDTAAGQARNRRVTIWIYPPKARE